MIFIFCILNLMHAVEDGKMRLFTDHLVGSIVAHGRDTVRTNTSCPIQGCAVVASSGLFPQLCNSAPT